jgi:hypothetical protein
MSFSTPVDNAAGQRSILNNLTFGLELEMLVLAPRNINSRKHLLKALRKPVLLPCSHCNRNHPWRLPVEDPLNSTGYVPPFSRWSIHRDPTVHPDDDEQPFIPESSNFYSLELVSRVMNFCKPTPDHIGQKYPCTGEPFTWDSQIEIGAFIQTIHEAFSDHGYCVTNNRTTGLHIHFGNGKDQPPVPTSLGMFAVFACLERHFDRLFPASRICVMPFDGLTPGLITPHPVYMYDQSRQQSPWIGAGSRAFLECIRSSVRDAIKDSPKVNRAFIVEELRDCTPGAWFNIMSGCDKVEDFLYSWPKADSVGNAICHRSIAVNLQNLTSNLGKHTLEVRAAPGSVDFPEVWAWTEFMGKLMLWLSTADIDHRSVIMDIWADPKSTILDLIKQVGVSQSTVDFYVDRLSADWAVRRHARLLSKIHRHHPFRAFLLVIENNLRLDYRIEAVGSKISQKLMGGYYGQISDALFQTLPVQFRNHPDNFLNMDTCDYGRFADKVIADAGVSITPEPKVRMDNSPNTTSPQILVQAPATPSAFNILPSSGLEDPFTHTSDRPTSLGSLRYPKTLDGSNILPYGRVTNHSRNGSDGSGDLQSSTTDVCDRTSAVSALSLSPD